MLDSSFLGTAKVLLFTVGKLRYTVMEAAKTE